ncbi:MAG TPA: OmpA family protein, partial [Bacteroidia bacterium]|nr:OmpA family protein [Bacteroidia bacterium]
KNNPNIKLEVIGNADQTNTDEYNLKLAQRRADNVKKILVQFGVDPSRLITKTNGERVPVTNGTNAYALQANRRVQFFVVK